MTQYRARYVEVLVVAEDAAEDVEALLPDGTEVTIERAAFENLYVPVVSTTAELAESVG